MPASLPDDTPAGMWFLVILTLPLGNYRFRANKNGQQYFSGLANHCSIPGCVSATITLPVTSGFIGGVKVLATLPRWSTSLSPNLSAGLQRNGTITTTVIRYIYDPLGRLTDANYSTGESFAYAYDAVGNPAPCTQRAGQAGGQGYSHAAESSHQRRRYFCRKVCVKSLSCEFLGR